MEEKNFRKISYRKSANIHNSINNDEANEQTKWKAKGKTLNHTQYTSNSTKKKKTKITDGHAIQSIQANRF